MITSKLEKASCVPTDHQTRVRGGLIRNRTILAHPNSPYLSLVARFDRHVNAVTKVIIRIVRELQPRPENINVFTLIANPGVNSAGRSEYIGHDVHLIDLFGQIRLAYAECIRPESCRWVFVPEMKQSVVQSAGDRDYVSITK